jgi:uncharacterized membrane protein YiaA
MALTITAILDAFEAIFGALVGTIGTWATWVVTNPMLLIGVAFTVVLFGLNIVRSFIKN